MTDDATEIDSAVVEQLQGISRKLKDAQGTVQREMDAILWRGELTKKDMYAERRALLKKIPEFWSTVLLGTFMDVVGDTDAPDAMEQEQAALKYLEDMWVELDGKNPRSGRMIFTFSSNPYFKETELVKAWSGEDATWKVVDPKVTWTKKIPLTGFFAWLFKNKDEDVIRDLVLEVFPHAVDIFFGGDESSDDDDADDDADDAGSESLEESEDEEAAVKPNKKQRKH